MPKSRKSVPSYRKHKGSGQAIVTLGGRMVYLGPHGTKTSRIEYDRVVAEWLARDRMAPAGGDDLTVNELLVRYWRFANQHYRKGGEPTNEVNNLRHALRPLKRLYGSTVASAFGPLALKALQQDMVGTGLSRGVVNARTNRIRRVFRWAVGEELVPLDLCHGLAAVPGLQRGRTEARETDPVGPVADDVFEATLGHLSPIVVALARFQRYTGCRPTEACDIRPADVNRTGEVWVYAPSSHKTEHHGKQRLVFIGPRGQEVLRPFLLRPSDTFCFSPEENDRRRRDELHAKRKTPSSCGNTVGSNRKKNPQRKPGVKYSRQSYAYAVTRACQAAGVPHWSPNQLRHSFATEVRHHMARKPRSICLGTLSYRPRKSMPRRIEAWPFGSSQR